jgi:hypothetical protein
MPESPDADATMCECCLGEPDLVCDACGQHSCWAGYYMCHESYGAGVVPAAEFAARDAS